jgi:hypothetical protein
LYARRNPDAFADRDGYTDGNAYGDDSADSYAYPVRPRRIATATHTNTYIYTNTHNLTSWPIADGYTWYDPARPSR